MARVFVSGSSESLTVNSSPVTDYPFTLACFVYCTQDTATQVVMSIADVDDTDYHAIGLAGAESDEAVAWTFDGASQTAHSLTGYTTNTWHHLAGVFTAADDRAAFIDGGSKGANEVSATPATPYDNVRIGVSADATPFGYFDGSVAEAAIWNVALTDEEIAVLATGVRPIYVRPQNLVFYAPLWRDEDEDYAGGLSLSVNGTPTIAAHPPVFYSSPQWTFAAAGAVGEYYQSAAGVFTPVGVISKETSKTFTGSSTLVGSLIKQSQKAFTGVTTASGVLVKQTGKIALGSITASGILVRSITKLFTGSLTAVGSLVKQTTKTFTGSLTASGILVTVKAALLSIGGSLTPSGTLVKQTGKILAGSLTATGSIVKQTAKAFVGSITTVGSLATQKIAGGFSQVVGGVLTMTGILVRQTNKQTAGIVIMAGSITKRISKSIGGVLTAVGTLVRQLLGLPVPATRIYAIETENRVYAIEAEIRIYAIETENRVYPIPG